MNGIFPDYVGPDQSAVHASLYPDWVNIDSVAPVQPTGGAGYEHVTPGGITKRDKQIREEDEIAAMIAMAFVEMMN